MEKSNRLFLRLGAIILENYSVKAVVISHYLFFARAHCPSDCRHLKEGAYQLKADASRMIVIVCNEVRAAIEVCHKELEH